MIRAVRWLAIGAVALRLLLFLGRGDYLAFDEGWYLLLARSLFTGDGYSLIGIPHVALSPLFPILAGSVGVVIDDWVWGGRIVAAVTSGLLVLPAWSIFRRLASERTAFITCALIAVLPTMAPFVVPYWIGADLWVGAEPVLHVLLYTGIALWLRADESRAEDIASRLTAWFLTGAVFALAFLARPEAIITWGLLGLTALAIAARQRSPRRLMGAALMGAGFLIVASPYWLYVHDATGQWSVAGREIAPVAAVTRAVGSSGRSGGSASTIERMLWQDDDAYEAFLYGLDETGLRLRSGYWGVQPEQAPGGNSPTRRPDAGEEANQVQADSTSTATRAGAPGADGTLADAGASRIEPDPTSGTALYIHSLGIILPLLLWPFVILGMARPRSRSVLRRELPVSASLIGTSVAIGVVVAVDPRTQLFLVPLLAFYAARGFAVVADAVRLRVTRMELRPGFVELLLTTVAVVWLLGIDVTRLYLSVAHGSPHHIVAEQNRAVAEELDELLDGDVGPVASWHPAIAVYADRDWRVLPFTDLSGVIRYEQAAGARAVVLSAYYPPPLGVENLDTRYVVLDMPETREPLVGWTIRLEPGDSIRRVAEVEPLP